MTPGDEMERKQRRDKKIESVMDNACSYLAVGSFAGLDNKTVNFPRLFLGIVNLVDELIEAEKRASAENALNMVCLESQYQSNIGSDPGIVEIVKKVKSQVAKLNATAERGGE